LKALLSLKIPFSTKHILSGPVVLTGSKQTANSGNSLSTLASGFY